MTNYSSQGELSPHFEDSIRISTGNGSNKGVIKNINSTWPDMVKKLSKHTISNNKDLGFFVGGGFSCEKRQDTFLECRSLLTLDIDEYKGTYDDLSFDLDNLCSVLDGVAYVVYSTFRSTTDAPRVRIVAPLAREVSGDEYRTLSRLFCAELPFTFDECSFKPNQFMYLPVCPDGTNAFVKVGEGVAVDVDKYLALEDKISVQSILPNNTYNTNTINDEDPFAHLPLQDVDVDKYLAAYPANNLSYDAWLEVGMALHHQFMGKSEGYQTWVDWSALSIKHNVSEMQKKYQSFASSTAKRKTFATIIYKTDIELPDPIAIKKELPPVMSFYADLLPDALSKYVFDAAERMPCPPDFVAVSLVCSIGAVVGAGCGIKPKQKDDWVLTPNFWGGVVAPPTAKKSPAIGAGFKQLDRLVVDARIAYDVDLRAYDKEMMIYKAKIDGLQSDLKSASKTTAKVKGAHTPEEIAELICKTQDSKPQPPILRRYKTNDSTIEKLGELERDNPSGILVLRDELIGLLASLDREDREGDRAFYLEGFNGTDSTDTDRIGRGHIFIPNHCLSVFGGIQPDKLIAYLEQASSGLGNDGLLQRFQLLVYPNLMDWGYRDEYPNKEAANAVFEMLKRLSETDFIEFGAFPIDDYNKRPYFRFTLDAQAFYIDWANNLHNQKIKNEENILIQQHLGKYDKLLPTLALVFHLVDCLTNHTQGQVSLNAIKKAAAWCEYLETHARRVYGLYLDEGARPAIALSSKIIALLKQPTAKTDETPENWVKDGFVFRDIRRKGWQHLKDDAAIKRALMVLIDNYWLYPKTVETHAQGGRPTTRYFISKKLTDAKQPTAKTDETQKMYSFEQKVGQKIGFGSFGSTLLSDFDYLESFKEPEKTVEDFEDF